VGLLRVEKLPEIHLALADLARNTNAATAPQANLN